MNLQDNSFLEFSILLVILVSFSGFTEGGYITGYQKAKQRYLNFNDGGSHTPESMYADDRPTMPLPMMATFIPLHPPSGCRGTELTGGLWVVIPISSTDFPVFWASIRRICIKHPLP